LLAPNVSMMLLHTLATMNDRGDDQHFLIGHLAFVVACLSDLNPPVSGHDAICRVRVRTARCTLASWSRSRARLRG
jgi:hypothetical protein